MSRPPRNENEIKIWREATDRGITRLYHFTPFGNARSILCNGLHSREALLANDIDFYITDAHRFDEHLNSVSVSVHSINETMFETKNRNYRGQMIVLELDASILWTHSCRFCWTNAASKEIRDHTGYLGGPWAFSKMFEDRSVNSNDARSVRGLYHQADFLPTDNQAEVQVFQPIEPDLIVDVTVGSHRVKEELEALMSEIDTHRPVVVYEELFRLRR